jgi:hypothetical protein
MTISIFSSKKTWSTPRSKELVRTDATDMEDAKQKMDDLLKAGHDLNGFVTNYEEPQPRKQARSLGRQGRTC